MLECGRDAGSLSSVRLWPIIMPSACVCVCVSECASVCVCEERVCVLYVCE